MTTPMDWLCPQAIAIDMDARNRWDALRAVSAIIQRTHSLSEAPVLRALWRREKAGSTGVGNGLAIPHARIAGIAEPVTVYARMKSPLDFASPDGKPVSELFVILVPADGADENHLQLLKRVAEAFSDNAFRALLAGASEPQAVRSAFSHWVGSTQADAVQKQGLREGGLTPHQRA
jgi:nitrogen PTS system EIIA component